MSPHSQEINVDKICFEPAFPSVANDDVVGWASATINTAYRLSELPIGRAPDGRLVVLCWPMDSLSPRTRRFMYGLSIDSRRDIARQIIAAIPIERGLDQ